MQWVGSTKRMTEEELRAAHCRSQAAYKARGSLVGGRSSAGRLPEAPPSIKWMPTQRGPSSPERRAPIVRSYIEYRPRMPARPLAHRDLSHVQQDGLTLGEIWSVGAKGPFNEDRGIVLAAVQQNGEALRYAAEPAPDATPDATPERDETEVKHDIDKIDEARYAELRRHYCEAYEEHDAPTLAGTSGARLRHKRKCRARIESDSAGYKALHKMIKQLDRISNHAEVYRLLSLLYEYEVHLAPRGIARPAALGGGAPADEVAEVVDLIGEENDIINVDTYILDVLRDKRDEQQVGGAAGPSSAAPLSAGDADGATRVKQERE